MIKVATSRDKWLIDALLIVWENSVRKTHDFLSESDIQNISKYVPEALNSIEHLFIAFDKGNQPIGFMGLQDKKIEMLFLDPKNIGQGIGKKFIQMAINEYNVNEVTVNEQNHHARSFYEHFGFQIYKRSEVDEQGNNFPILYMKLSH